MKLPTLALLFTLLLAAVLLTGALAEPASDFNLWWRAIANGGGDATSSSFASSGTVGQAVVGSSTGGDYRFGAGYWYGEAIPAPSPEYRFYLPNILRKSP
jgi:hypothetical protein